MTESLLVEESYDSSVFQQSHSRLAHAGSWVSTISPMWSIATPPTAEDSLAITYTPSWTRFHSVDSENHVAHRLLGSVRFVEASFSMSGTANYSVIDGSDEGVVWSGQGGVSATGAPTVRDRRDQAVLRASAALTWKVDAWSIGTAGTYYHADFQTAHRTTPGYLNYVDRSDATIGADLTHVLGDHLKGGLSYRLGHQDQARLLSYPEEFDNTYHRILGLLDGKLTPWLAITLTAGPEFRSYGTRTPAAMGDRDVVNLFVDGSASITLTRSDSVTLTARQFEMLSSSGRGAFNDLNLDVSWRHTVSKHATASVALHAYNTDFLKPTMRDDWILSVRATAALTMTEHWRVDVTLSCEDGFSRVENTPARDFTRYASSCGVRYTF